MKEQIANKQKDVEKSECDLQESKENYARLEQQVNDDRRAFEHLLHQQEQSSGEMQDQLKVSLIACKACITHIDEELP